MFYSNFDAMEESLPEEVRLLFTNLYPLHKPEGPRADVTIRQPADEDGVWKVEYRSGRCGVDFIWSSRLGYGVTATHLLGQAANEGQEPEHVVETAEQAVAKAMDILREQSTAKTT